jgi:hypothetical protein
MADTTARIRLALEGQGQVVQGLKQVEDGTASLKRSMASLVGGLSLGAAVGQLVQVQREFDVLNSSLITVTGSSAAAQREMKWIKEFAASTPYGLNEVTSAFVKMKALGLDPSQKALTSYGNTASAMGKGLNQMIEAVADAATGEFERLKEFGIKAKKQGDDVSLTFRGVTTSIGNNAGEITAYLQKLGDNDFAGAMATRAATLDGAISNLGDSWDELFRTVSQNDVGGLIMGSVRLANAALGDAVTIIQALNGGMRENARDTGIMVSAQSAVATVFETVAVLGANVKFVLVSVGRELGGIAAQAVQILQGNFAGAAAIRSQMIADGEAGRREVDATTARVLNARRLLGIAATGVGMDEPRFSRLLNPTASTPVGSVGRPGAASRTAATKANTAAEKELAEAQKQSAQVVALRNKLVEEGFEAHQKAMEAARAADADLVRQYANAASSAQQRLTDLEHEAEAVAFAERNQIGLAQAVELTTIARLKEQQVGAMGNEAIVLQLQAEIEAREKIVGMLNSTEARDAGRELRKNEAAEWARTWDQVGQSFTDALMQGGKSVSEYLKDLFRTLVLRPILAPVGGAMASLLGGPAAAGQGGGSIMGTINSLSGVMNNLATSSANFLSGATINAQAASAWTRAGDWMATSSSNTMANAGSWMQSNPGAGAALGMAGNAVAGYGIQKTISNGYKTGESGLVDAITVAASAYFGPIAGVVAGVFNRAFGRKLKDIGVQGEFGGDAGFSGSGYEFHKGGWFRSDKTKTTAMDGELRAALASQYELLADNTTGLAGQLKLSAAALETYNRKIKFSTKGLTEDQIVARLNEEFGAMGEEMAALVLGTTAYTREGETASATLVRLASSITGANTLLGVLDKTLFDVGLVGANMASELADLFGGLDAMAQATAAYYQTYYTASERADAATAAMTTSLGALGLSLPNTNAGFRALVDGLDLTTEHGRTTYAALLQMAPEFAALQVELQRLADETAAQLIAAFTGRGQLLPALGSMAGAIATTATGAVAFAGPVSTINRLLGDAASGVLVFGDRVTSTTSALTPAQLAVAALHGEVFALRTAASGTVVDVAGLGAALAAVDTRAFVATVVGVFEIIGQRIQDTLATIADERAALREAAVAIIAPGGMTPAQIRAGITASMVGLPSNAGVAKAQAAMATADALLGTRQKQELAAAVKLSEVQSSAGRSATRNAQLVATAQTRLLDMFDHSAGIRNLVGGDASRLLDGSIAPGTRATAGGSAWGAWANSDTLTEELRKRLLGLSAAQAQQVYAAKKWAADIAAATTKATAAAAATVKQQAAAAAAATGAQTAQLAYIDALQKYSLDSSKAVANLGRLREETVRYYESQKQLAELMTGTASTLRATVAQFRFDQLDPVAQFASLQDRYNVAYSMALSTTGDTLAGYGAELNNLINPLLAKAQEAGVTGSQYSSLVNTVLARAEATATRLEANAPKNYQAESLGLLGQIDSTLAALEAGALTADQLIVNAINSGRDSTRDGLRAVVAALTGSPIPAFALGGMHAGGVRLVGENGPELEVTGPSRIYSAGQTRAMLGGGNNSEAVVAELRALRQEVAALRRENTTLQTQTVVNTGKAYRLLDRFDGDGLPVRNVPGETLTTEAA